MFRLVSDIKNGEEREIVVETSEYVCSSQIVIKSKDDTILSVEFVGGCQGNTIGISSLCCGMKIRDVIERLEGINCGGKPTSCPDQLASALKFLL